MDISKLTSIYGKISVFTVPSGFKVAIREQNGDDDAVLSNVALSKEATSVNAFIQGIIIGSSLKEGLLEEADILKMRLRDKYFTLIQSRIFSNGSILNFQYEWVQGAPPVDYEEDLSQFVWDYELPFPTKNSKDYFSGRIQPYPKAVEYPTLIVGEKKIKINYLDGEGELYLLRLPDHRSSINSKLIARNIQMEVKGEWMPIESFAIFSSREMSRIRTWVDEVDPNFDGLISITDPSMGTSKLLPLISLPDFFFPREI